MKTLWQRAAALAATAFVLALALAALTLRPGVIVPVEAQNAAAKPELSLEAQFDQAAALAKLREQIKGHENDPATKVWKNIKTPFLQTIPAGRLLAVMEMGYSRSLGVTCTHCHIPDKWESDENPDKQVARDMAAMMTKINTELLKGIPNLSSQQPTINCTTCHRGQTKPALNLPMPPKA